MSSNFQIVSYIWELFYSPLITLVVQVVVVIIEIREDKINISRHVVAKGLHQGSYLYSSYVAVCLLDCTFNKL